MTMSFRLAILGLLAVSCCEAKRQETAKRSTNNHLTVDSVLGQKLLEKAEVLEQPDETLLQLRGRRRDNENNNNYNQQQQYDNQNGIYDLANLYISYSGCSSFLAPDQGDSGDGAEINYYNWQQYSYYQQQEQEQQGDDDDQQDDQQGNGNAYYNKYNNNGLVQQSLVLFTLCSKSNCRKCSGQYAIDMVEFLNIYTEMKMEKDEYDCEYVREHCYCSNGYSSYEYCLATCYSNAGLDNCMQEYYGGESFQLQEYLECQAAFGGGNNNGGNNQNNNYNYNKNNFYIGPYCAEGQYIYLGAFYDEDCSNQADSDTFQEQNYGDGFPYFNEPILYGNECLSCLPVGEDVSYNNNQYNNDDNGYEANELCERSTEEAIKCDSSRGYASGCNFLEYTLPCLDGRGCVEQPKEDDGYNGNSGNYAYPGGNNDMTTDLYFEMAAKFEKYKRVAYAMAAVAGFLLLVSISMCLWCCCRPSLLQSSKRNPLLRRRPMGTIAPAEHAQ